MSTVTKPILLNETFITKMDALIAKFGKHTLTITCTSDDSVAVTNQTIKIYDATTGILFGTFVYNAPTSITVDIADGFNYKIVCVCTLNNHYVDVTPTGIMSGNTTITITYKSLGNLSTFPGIKAALNAGLGSRIPIGTEVSFTHTEYGELTYEVVDYDEEEDVITLLQEETLNPQFKFDEPEALYRPTTALSAGNYTFKNGSTSYYFTLTEAVPANGQISATASQFFTYSSQTSEVAIESGTVSTTALSDTTDLGTCASGLLNHLDRVNYGSNDYGESAIRQWLNASGINWWQPKTMFDRPASYNGTAGFLGGVPQEVLDVIDTTAVKCVAQNTYCAPDSNHSKGSTYTCNDKFFLASDTEIFGSAIFVDGSKIYDYYVGASASDRIKRYNTSARRWWLRSPSSTAFYVRVVSSSGSVNDNNASTTNSVVSACKISKSSE